MAFASFSSNQVVLFKKVLFDVRVLEGITSSFCGYIVSSLRKTNRIYCPILLRLIIAKIL
jgi:hypothetical protein